MNFKNSISTLAFFLMLLMVSVGAHAQNYSFDQKMEGNDKDGSFAAFKQNGVETFCTVSRIGDSPSFGNTEVGPKGGAKLTDEEALEAYDCIRFDMQDGYAKSRHPYAKNYMEWEQFSNRPYLSKSHSRRYVTNYANAIAAPFYRNYEQSGTLPPGSVLAKDSFVVTPGGRVVYSALGLMEKMPAGFNPEGGDWRFTMILPDGRIFGSTNADDSFTVEFCQKCHQDAGADQDYLFFMPNKYRR